MMSTTGQKPATTLLPDCIQAALFHWCGPKEMTMGETDRKYKATFSLRRFARGASGAPSTLRRPAKAARSKAWRGSARSGQAAENGVR